MIVENNKGEKYLKQIKDRLGLTTEELEKNKLSLVEINAVYYWNGLNNQTGIIVGEDGDYLINDSPYNMIEDLIEEYKNGKRSGNFNNASLLIKIKCHACGNKITIDSSKISNDKGILDTICPNCKTLIKYNNLNYNQIKNNNMIDENELIVTPSDKENQEILRKQRIIRKLMKARKYDESKMLLIDLLHGAKVYEEIDLINYYSFDNIVEYFIFKHSFNHEKKVLLTNVPYHELYNELAIIYNKNNDSNNVFENINKSLQWNPISLKPLFIKCRLYILQNKLIDFKLATEELYGKIYFANDLAHYYRNLGYYYLMNNELDIAYALYIYSLEYDNDDVACLNIEKINQKLKRKYYDISKEEIKSLLLKYKIPFEIKKENIDLLLYIYTNERKALEKTSSYLQLVNCIYNLIKVNKNNFLVKEYDEKLNCSLFIPAVWNRVEVKDDSIRFCWRNVNNNLVQVICDGFCSSKEFNVRCEEVTNDILKLDNNPIVLTENSIKLHLEQGIKTIKQVLFEFNDENNRRTRLLHNFTIINGMFVSFLMPISVNINYRNNDSFNNQKCIKDLIAILLTIYEY